MSQEVFSDPSYSVPQLRFFTLITGVFFPTQCTSKQLRVQVRKNKTQKNPMEKPQSIFKRPTKAFFPSVFFSDEDSTSRPVILLKYVCKAVSQAGLSSQDPGLIWVTMSIDPAEMAGEKCFG